MSVMDELTNVVNAARNLLDTVSGKMQQIDNKVDEAVEGVPEEIRSQMDRTVYVDQVNGSDNNDGYSPSKAYASFQKVADETPAGSAIQVYVIGDCIFPPGGNASFTANQVFIRSYDSNVKGKIKFYGYIHDGNYRTGGFSAYRNTLFNFLNINLEMPDIPSGEAKTGYRTGVISTHAGADVPTPLFLRLNGVEIFVPDSANNPFRISTGTGIVMLSTSSVTAPQDWVDAGGLLSYMPGASNRISTKLIHEGSALIPST